MLINIKEEKKGKGPLPQLPEFHTKLWIMSGLFHHGVTWESICPAAHQANKQSQDLHPVHAAHRVWVCVCV